MSAERAYTQLRAEIVDGRVLPNERLVEADLSERLGAGRGAVRAALQRLEHDGLVEHERHRGARVRLVGQAEAIEILEARAALEALAARSAAERITPEEAAALHELLAGMRARRDAGDLLGMSDLNAVLHRRLLELSGHATARRLVEALNSQLVRFQFRTILVAGRPDRSLAEHTAIVEAVARGDGAAAEAAMRTHLQHVALALREAPQASMPMNV